MLWSENEMLIYCASFEAFWLDLSKLLASADFATATIC